MPLGVAGWLAVASVGISAIGLYNNMSSADANDKLRRQQEEKNAKYNLAKQEIARQIQDRADVIISVWANHYLPVELETLNEIANEPFEVARTALVTQRARGEIAKIYEVARRSSLYCLSPQQVGLRIESEINIATRQADTTAGLIRTVVKQEHARAALVNAQRIVNKMNMINPGRGHAAAAASALTTAARHYDKLSQETAENIKDATYALGRSVAGAVSNGAEIVKAVSSTELAGIFQRPEAIRREPVYGTQPTTPESSQPMFVLNIQTDSTQGREEG